MSVRKMRIVLDNIRGKGVEEGLNLLRYTNKEAATWLEKLVLAGVANWEHKNGMSVSADDYDLVIKTAFADQAPMLKRFRPAPQGRAHRIRKHSNHVTIVLENRIPLPSENEPEVEEEATVEE